MSRDVQIEGAEYSYRFRAGWQSGRQQLAEAISLEYVNPRDAVERANLWAGRLLQLEGKEFALTAIVSDRPTDGRRKQYDQALRILKNAPRMRKVLSQSEAPAFAQMVLADARQ